MNKAKNHKKFIGNLGEELAAKYLTQKGYIILDRNYLKKWGEIDVIARKMNRYYFVEVKTVSRRVGDFEKTGGYRPEENMHPWKIKRLYRAIESYLMEKGIDENTEWQLDLVSVYLDTETKKAKVDYLENIA